MTAPLSPAAQAILRAAGDSEPGIYATIAATLRALAVRINGADAIRQDILDIAAELDPETTPLSAGQ
jgi:hypothetical protein